MSKVIPGHRVVDIRGTAGARNFGGRRAVAEETCLHKRSLRWSRWHAGTVRTRKSRAYRNVGRSRVKKLPTVDAKRAVGLQPGLESFVVTPVYIVVENDLAGEGRELVGMKERPARDVNVQRLGFLAILQS